ncbi:MAG: hypothetical protein WC560_02105 [Syntrophales bacterium]
MPLSFKRLKFNTVDAAISETDLTLSGTTILGIGAPASTAGTAAVGMGVIKSGRTTGVTTGTIVAVNMTVRVNYGSSCGTATFKKQVSITPGTFSDSGDSGSVILDAATKKPVALLFAGSSKGTIGNPIAYVLSQLGVSIHATIAAATEENSMEEEIQGPDADPQVAPLAEIQTRHEGKLLQIRGVVGIGIGQTADGKDLGFIVHTEKNLSSQSLKRIPASLEGIPVRIIESGEFTAR